jgi:hypothetical protein
LIDIKKIIPKRENLKNNLYCFNICEHNIFNLSYSWLKIQ